MQCREDHRPSDWLRKAVCRRYAFVHFAEFHMANIGDGRARRQRWCWAFAMFAADEFEVLGAWPADTGAVEPLIEDLRNRGVLSIRVVSIAEAKGSASQLSFETWAAALQHAEPRVLEIVGSQALFGEIGEVGEAVEGVPSAAILSALRIAGRIHGSLLRAARSRAPFASSEAASEFIANWLQKADGRPYEVRRPPKPAVAHAA